MTDGRTTFFPSADSFCVIFLTHSLAREDYKHGLVLNLLIFQRDQNGLTMNVPPQCIDTCLTNRQADVVAIVVGVVSLVVVLLLILCIICAVCIKKKKRLEKHSFIMVNFTLLLSIITEFFPLTDL